MLFLFLFPCVCVCACVHLLSELRPVLHTGCVCVPEEAEQSSGVAHSTLSHTVAPRWKRSLLHARERALTVWPLTAKRFCAVSCPPAVVSVLVSCLCVVTLMVNRHSGCVSTFGRFNQQPSLRSLCSVVLILQEPLREKRPQDGAQQWEDYSGLNIINLSQSVHSTQLIKLVASFPPFVSPHFVLVVVCRGVF